MGHFLSNDLQLVWWLTGWNRKSRQMKLKVDVWNVRWWFVDFDFWRLTGGQRIDFGFRFHLAFRSTSGAIFHLFLWVLRWCCVRVWFLSVVADRILFSFSLPEVSSIRPHDDCVFWFEYHPLFDLVHLIRTYLISNRLRFVCGIDREKSSVKGTIECDEKLSNFRWSKDSTIKRSAKQTDEKCERAHNETKRKIPRIVKKRRRETLAEVVALPELSVH